MPIEHAICMPRRFARRGRPPSKELGPVDIHVGSRIRWLRTLQGMSQGALADAAGVTFQQIQKYEGGQHRISAGRLWSLSKALNCPVDFFFDGETGQDQETAKLGGASTNASSPADDETNYKRETLELVRVYMRINGDRTRQTFMDLLKTVAGGAAAPKDTTQQAPARD